MADTFGKNGSGRLYDGGRFYAVPAADVAANAPADKLCVFLTRPTALVSGS